MIKKAILAVIGIAIAVTAVFTVLEYFRKDDDFDLDDYREYEKNCEQYGNDDMNAEGKDASC